MQIFEGDHDVICCYIKRNEIFMKFRDDQSFTEVAMDNDQAAKLSKLLHKLSEELGCNLPG